jgi:hypothetical protein
MKDPIQESLNKIRLVESQQASEDFSQDAGDLGRGIWQGATFGLGNKIAAGAQSLVGKQSYQDYLAQHEKADAAAAERSPWLYGAGELAGGIGVPGAGLAGMAARKGATKLAGKVLGSGEKATKWAGRAGKAGEAGASNAINTVGSDVINQAGGSMLDKLAVPAAAAGAVGLGAAAANTVGSRKLPPDPKVQALQNKLIAKGAIIAPDGVMGPQTRAAMKKYGITNESKSSIMMELEDMEEGWPQRRPKPQAHVGRDGMTPLERGRAQAAQSRASEPAPAAAATPPKTMDQMTSQITGGVGGLPTGDSLRGPKPSMMSRIKDQAGNLKNKAAGMIPANAGELAKKGAKGLGVAAGLGLAGAAGAYGAAKGYNALKDKFGGGAGGDETGAAGTAGGQDGAAGAAGGGQGGAVDTQAAPDNSEIFAKLDQLFSELADDNDPETLELYKEYEEFKSQNSTAGKWGAKIGGAIKTGGDAVSNFASQFGRAITAREDVELDSVLRNAGLGHN